MSVLLPLSSVREPALVARCHLAVSMVVLLQAIDQRAPLNPAQRALHTLRLQRGISYSYLILGQTLIVKEDLDDCFSSSVEVSKILIQKNRLQ